jgi:membrane protease YdiL (CAAX protease family)
MTVIASLLILAWAHFTHKPWGELGFVRPRDWPVTIALGIGSGFLFKLAMKAIVMPLLGAPAINPAYHFIAGNAGALAGMFLVSIVDAGFGEELVYRGFLFDRLGRLLGHGTGARSLTVMLTSVLFAAAHLSGQGRSGAEQALITGLVFGVIFARTGSLWLPMVAHAAFDVTAVLLIYLNLESTVAHLVFK